ncbi:hypothetical protein [Alteriqipengyuania sp. 357]
MAAHRRERFPALIAIALPVLAGLASMALFGAPHGYLIVNGSALLAAGAILLIGMPRFDRRAVRIAGGVFVLIFALPLLSGPHMNGIARWLPVGPFILHAGMLTIPALAVLAGRERLWGPVALFAAILIALVQPDFASAFALTGAATGLYQVRPDWRIGIVIIIGFLVAISAALRGELPPAPFVERVLQDASSASPIMAVALALSLAIATLVMLFGTGLPRTARYPLGMSLFGFLVAALISNYPTPLAGYGAAAIIGFALAHAIAFALPEANEAPR